MIIMIKTLDESNRPAWAALYKDYANFYGMPMTDATLEAVWGWVQAGISLQGRVAMNEAGEVVGLMHFRAMPSPLRGSEVGFLDDLYVAPEHRGSGVVNAMLSAFKEEALAHDWPFVRWITREKNYRARTVYDRSADQTDWVLYQMNSINYKISFDLIFMSSK